MRNLQTRSIVMIVAGAAAATAWNLAGVRAEVGIQARQISALQQKVKEQGDMIVHDLNPVGGNNQGAWATVEPMCKSGKPEHGLTVSQAQELCHSWDMPYGSAPDPSPSIGTTASTNPKCSAVRCIRVPNQNATGLAVYGSSGWGGTSIVGYDKYGDPEFWFRYGGEYILVKPHMLGPGYCIDVALKTDYCLSFPKAGGVVRWVKEKK